MMTVNHPVELYELILSVYKETPRERLLEFMAGHPNIEDLRNLPQIELVKILAEAVANKHVLFPGDAAPGEAERPEPARNPPWYGRARTSAGAGREP